MAEILGITGTVSYSELVRLTEYGASPALSESIQTGGGFSR